MQFPSFSQLTVGTPATTNMLIALFLVIFVVWLIHMFVTMYHWKQYGNSKRGVLRMQIIYFAGSAVLFVALMICISYYSMS